METLLNPTFWLGFGLFLPIVAALVCTLYIIYQLFALLQWIVNYVRLIYYCLFPPLKVQFKAENWRYFLVSLEIERFFIPRILLHRLLVAHRKHFNLKKL